MADLILPARFTSQPQYPARLDTSNPLAAFPAFVCLPNFEVAGNLPMTRAGSSVPTVTPGAAGLATSFTSGTSAVSYLDLGTPAGPSANIATGPFTMVAVFTAGGTSQVSLAERNDANATNIGWLFGTNTGALGFLVEYSSTNLRRATSAALAAGVNTMVVTHDGSQNAANLDIYLNGELTGVSLSVNGVGSQGSDVARNLYVGRQSFGSSQSHGGLIFLVGAFRRRWSASEVKAFTANPWQIFEAPAQRLWPRDSATGDVTVALTGAAITASAGSLTAALAVAGSGQAITGSAGSVTPATAKAATGEAITAAAGTLAPATSVAAGGEAITSAQGSVGAGSDVIVALTGEAITASAGSVTPATAKAITGEAATAAAGTLAPATSLAASGQAATASAGTLAPALTLPLAGEAITAAAGTVSAGNDVTVALTGQAISASAGSLGVTVALGISGEAGTVAAGTATAGTSTAASGQSITSGQGALAPATSLALAGTSITGSAGTVTAQAGSNVTVALSGVSITASLGVVVIPVFSSDTRPHYTVTPGATRLGYAAEAVQTGRLGHSNERIAAKRLGARTK